MKDMLMREMYHATETFIHRIGSKLFSLLQRAGLYVAVGYGGCPGLAEGLKSKQQLMSQQQVDNLMFFFVQLCGSESQ